MNFRLHFNFLEVVQKERYVTTLNSLFKNSYNFIFLRGNTKQPRINRFNLG